MSGKAENMTGKRYGKLIVLRRAEKIEGKRVQWVCQCECGNTFVAQSRYLKSGQTKSCGCLKGGQINEMRQKEMFMDSESLDALNIKIGDPYENLANAIIVVAADDYRFALKSHNNKLKSSLENFFRSEWYGILSDFSGSSLLSLLQEESESAV